MIVPLLRAIAGAKAAGFDAVSWLRHAQGALRRPHSPLRTALRSMTARLGQMVSFIAQIEMAWCQPSNPKVGNRYEQHRCGG